MRFTLPKIQLNNKFVQLNIKLREDRAILFICISIALIFWVLVKLSQPYRTEKEIILDFRLPYDKTYTTAPPKDMMATIEGNGWDLMLDFFSNPRITLSYDLRQTDRLDLNLPQLRAAVNTELFSRNIKILELNYGGLYLQLEDEISRLIPVDLVSDISVEKDYELSQPPILKPDSVLISGPVSIIDSLKSWPTDSFVLNNLKNNTEVDLKLVNFPPELSAN
ncbi:MAG: YbbR-like domain-containing protein, partial [Bacteroidota bacterium]